MFEIVEKSLKNEIEMSDYLKNATGKINQFHKIAKNSIYGISLILAHICEYPSAYFENSHFSTIAEYAETMFGYKKSYTYKLIKISKFISIVAVNGEELNVKDFIEDKIIGDYDFDVVCDADGFEYSPSQMLELIPLTDEQLKENIKTLDSSLTCKELRAVVKDIISPPIETTGADSKDSTDSTDSTEQEDNKEEEKAPQLTDKERIMQMLEICSNMENEEIKTKIINVFQKSLKALEK